MELELQMLVSEYAQNVINNRPLKYGTRQSYIKIIKSLGIWETEISDLNCALIFDKVVYQFFTSLYTLLDKSA